MWFFGWFLVFYSLVFALLNVQTLWGTYVSYGLLYCILFYVPKFAPLVVFGGFLVLRESRFYSGRFVRRLCFGSFGIVAVTLAVSVLMVFSGRNLLDTRFVVDGVYPWTWTAIISYLSVWLISFVSVYRRFGDCIFGFVFSCLMVSALGMVHEIAVYHPFVLGHYLDISYPFVLCTKFFSLVFLVFMVAEKGWKPEKTFWCASALFVFHSVFWVVNFDVMGGNFVFGCIWQWVPRLVGAFLLLSLVFGMKNG